jgi:hypothetical protein
MSDYGKALDDFDRMVRAFKALPANLIVISQVAPKQYEVDIVKPQFVGKHTANNITRMMDIVGYLYKAEGGGAGRILTFDAVEFVTKDRSAVLPTNIENATHRDLYRYWDSMSEEE